MSDVVRYETDGEIAVLTVNYPPVNALSHAVRSGIIDGINKANADDAVKAIALLCEGRTFIAGADITEFGKPRQDPGLRDQNVVQEDSPKPMVAGIFGTALGGGLETALACHYRVAVPSARVGLPEVKLGIIPGAGGTQRLPRLIGIEKAIDMICSGDPIPAGKAAELGVIDRIIEGDLREGTLAFCRELLTGNAELVKVRDRTDKLAADPEIFANARKTWAKKKRGFEAPQYCIDAVEAAATKPFDDGMQVELDLITKAMASAQSLAQRHFFFAERQANKIPDVPKDTPLREINKAAVLGAGTMGGGIAMNFANAGIPTVIVEREQDALDRGLGIIRKNYENTAKKGRLTMEQVEQRMACLSGSLDFDAAVSNVDIVIEAVFENMDLKKEIFGKLDTACKPGAILATNTSTLDIDEIAACTSRPQDVIGLHFFSPANVMRLLEEVRGKETAPDVIATCMSLAKRIGKVPVLVGVCHGFVGNRMLHAYFNQAFSLLYEGCQPQDVDGALYAHGMAMGPFAMSDLAGLDVSWRIRQETGEKSPIADRICEMGRFGQKTGGGYYDYKEGSRTPVPNDEVAQIVEEEGVRKHNHRRTIDAGEIVDRCMLALVNEGAKILEEGIAMRASDIDVVYVYGYGYPVYRGGPMCWADQIGLPKVLEKIKAFHAAGYGDAVWSPSPLIERLVAKGKSFKDFDKG
ncbi:MAG: 3-hydroxyacyl-CoA dehydrogenase NAD-binding domain-containing protein [Pseudomonadota bacterium]